MFIVTFEQNWTYRVFSNQKISPLPRTLELTGMLYGNRFCELHLFKSSGIYSTMVASCLFTLCKKTFLLTDTTQLPYLSLQMNILHTYQVLLFKNNIYNTFGDAAYNIANETDFRALHLQGPFTYPSRQSSNFAFIILY